MPRSGPAERRDSIQNRTEPRTQTVTRTQTTDGGANGRSISERVIDALAKIEGVEPLALAEPLNDAIDPEALDALFTPRYDGTTRAGDGLVTFTSNGHQVTVRKNGDIRVETP